MKRIKVKPIEPIEIELKDKTFLCTFTMMGMAYMQEELGKLEGTMDEISPARMAALVLYCGIKPNEPDFTMEEAVALSLQIGPSSYGDILGAFNEAVYDSMDIGNKSELKKALAQYLSNARK